MPPHDPATGQWPDPSARTGTVYGAGGAPVTSRTTPVDRWLMPGALAVGGLGVLVGLLFVLGLTPFGPDEVAAPAPQPPAAPAGTGGPSGTAAGAASPSPSSAPTPTLTRDPRVQRGALRSAVSSLCLQPDPDEDSQGAPVLQLPCSGEPAQQWQTSPAEGDLVTIENVDTERCLDVNDEGKDDGAAVQQWRCHGRSNQQWRIVPAGSAFALVSANSGKCLDVPGARTEPELGMQQFTCNGTPAQLWTWVQ